MTRIALVWSVVAAMSAWAVAQPATKPAGPLPGKDEVRKAIDDFLQKPEAGPQARMIMRFAEESEDVLIAPFQEMFGGWVKRPPKYPQADVLFTAWVAGNVREQLDKNVNRDEGYAGWQALFKVYDQLQKTDKDLKIPEIEEMRQLDKDGKLKARVEELQKQHIAPDQQPGRR